MSLYMNCSQRYCTCTVLPGIVHILCMFHTLVSNHETRENMLNKVFKKMEMFILYTQLTIVTKLCEGLQIVLSKYSGPV